MPDCKNTNVVSRRCRQNDFRNQVSLQKSSPEENHCGRNDEPRCRDPLHRINHFVIESKMVDQQNRNSRARVKNKWRPAGLAVNSDLVDAQSKKIRAEQVFWSRFAFCFCSHSSGTEIIVSRVLPVHESFLTFAKSTASFCRPIPSASGVLECASSET